MKFLQLNFIYSLKTPIKARFLAALIKEEEEDVSEKNTEQRTRLLVTSTGINSR